MEMYLKEKALFWGAAAAEELVAQQTASKGLGNTGECLCVRGQGVASKGLDNTGGCCRVLGHGVARKGLGNTGGNFRVRGRVW